MTQFFNISGISPVKNQILLLDGNYSHFNPCTLTQSQRKNIETFIIKAGDSIKNQSNDNRPNTKLKSLYNTSKAKWILKYGTSRFQPHHTNSALVETRESFTVSTVNIIRDRFAKTHLPPLILTNTEKNTQACVSSIQKF